MITEINFKENGKRRKFKVKHNLDKMRLSIDSAFINWSARTKDYSIESFCEYVKSKDVLIKCKPA